MVSTTTATHMLHADGGEDRVRSLRVVWIELYIEELYEDVISRKQSHCVGFIGFCLPVSLGLRSFVNLWSSWLRSFSASNGHHVLPRYSSWRAATHLEPKGSA